MHQAAAGIDVRGAAVGCLHDGDSAAVVTRVAPSLGVDGATASIDVEVGAAGLAHGAATAPEVAAPPAGSPSRRVSC